MMRRAAVVLAALAAVSAAALAFEFTGWSGGSLACATKVKVKQGEGSNETVTTTGAGLTTQETTFDFTNLGPGTLSGQMSRRNDRNYRTFQFEPGPQYDAFVAWVHDKILMTTGIDVTITEATLKGKFVLAGDFQSVKVLDKIKFEGTVAAGPDSGKTVKGSIKLSGILARDT